MVKLKYDVIESVMIDVIKIKTEINKPIENINAPQGDNTQINPIHVFVSHL